MQYKPLHMIHPLFHILFIICAIANVHANDGKPSDNNNPDFLNVQKTTSFAQHSTVKNENVIQIRKEIDSIYKNLETSIGNAACKNSNQCKSVAIGKKACGGPVSYLAYSTNNFDTKKIIALSSKHQQLSHTHNQLTNATSDCSIITKPNIECINNSCR